MKRFLGRFHKIISFFTKSRNEHSYFFRLLSFFVKPQLASDVSRTVRRLIKRILTLVRIIHIPYIHISIGICYLIALSVTHNKL
jgi:hypothetical protein